MVSDFAWGCFIAFSNLHRKMSESLMYQLSQCKYSCIVLFFAWDIGICLSTDTSGYSWSRHRKMSVYIYLNIHYYQVLKHRKSLNSGASCSPNQNRCVLSSYFIYSCVFCPSDSAAESMSTAFHLGRMQNDVNLYCLPNPFYFCPIYCYISP